jgi:hypothetical protein
VSEDQRDPSLKELILVCTPVNMIAERYICWMLLFYIFMLTPRSPGCYQGDPDGHDKSSDRKSEQTTMWTVLPLSCVRNFRGNSRHGGNFGIQTSYHYWDIFMRTTVTKYIGHLYLP